MYRLREFFFSISDHLKYQNAEMSLICVTELVLCRIKKKKKESFLVRLIPFHVPYSEHYCLYDKRTSQRYDRDSNNLIFYS